MRRIGTLVLAVAAVSAQSVTAATISYLGYDTTTQAAWRSPGVAKTAVIGADPNGDNIYGTDGYDVAGGLATPGTWGTPARQSSLPSYISSVTALATTHYATYTYQPLDDPSQPIVGGAVANYGVTGLWNMPTGPNGENTGITLLPFFDVTLASDKTFVLGIILTTAEQNISQTRHFKVTSSTGADSGVTHLVPGEYSAPAKYAFYQLSGVAGEVFTVSLAQAWTTASTSGITFEAVVPEPASLSLLALGTLALLKRRRA